MLNVAFHVLDEAWEVLVVQFDADELGLFLHENFEQGTFAAVWVEPGLAWDDDTVQEPAREVPGFVEWMQVDFGLLHGGSDTVIFRLWFEKGSSALATDHDPFHGLGEPAMWSLVLGGGFNPYAGPRLHGEAGIEAHVTQKIVVFEGVEEQEI